MKDYKAEREFRRKVLEPWLVDWPPRWCTCAICGKDYPIKRIAVCHVKTRGAHFELKYEPLNAFAGCSGIYTNGCHEIYDALPEDLQEQFIKDNLPGGEERLKAIERLIKEKAFVAR